MLTLNLISGKLKTEIKLRHIYNLQVTLNYVFVIILLFSATVLLISKAILQDSFDRIVGDTSLVTKNGQSYNAKVREINSKLKSVEKIQNSYLPFSYLLENIGAESPAGITFSSVNIDKDQATIKISGHAQTRDALLALDNALEKNTVFKNIDFPLKNILVKDNIDFDINANLDIDTLKSSSTYESPQ